MDMLNPPQTNGKEKKKKNKNEKKDGFSSFKKTFKSAFEKRREDRLAPALDIVTFALSFVFARSHLVFGAHPLAIAFISVLPSRVWIAAVGAIVGSLTLGKTGIIYSMISAIAVFLRIIISGTEKGEKVSGGEKFVLNLFNESLILRMSSSLISGFIAAIYEILLSGFTLTTVSFGVSMIILPPLITFAFSGLFSTGISVDEIFKSDLPVLSVAGKSDKDKYNIIFFQGSVLMTVFLISLALTQYQFLGISLSYIFSSVATLYSCRRFGSFRGAAVGFASSLGLSSSYSVAFALAGLVGGTLFNIGVIYSVLGGAFVLSVWCFYANGLTGLLTVLPEYLISSAVMYPVLKKVKAEKTETEVENTEKTANEMVGTMALAYKNNYKGSLDGLIASLMSVSSVVEKYTENTFRPSVEELEDLISECEKKYCESYDEESKYDTFPYEKENLDKEKLALILFRKGKISKEDIDIENYGEIDGLLQSINRAVAILSREKYKNYGHDSFSEDISLIAKLINEARLRDEKEKTVDESLTEALDNALLDSSVSDGIIRVFGERVKHIIVALEDESGVKITSSQLRSNIEKALSAKLGMPEYYRKGKMALMECSTTRMYGAECAVATVAGRENEISGDTACAFETGSGYFYSLISDGMGSGDEAHEVSKFVTEFLNRSLELGESRETLLRILNNTVRRGRDECSATVDMFGIDLFSGDSMFIKSGAAPSYVKRGASIFRIRSKTAPLGLLKELDAEKIRVDIQSDDYIIMFSDGVNQTGEDAPWLLELLSKPPKDDLKEYADFILKVALENVPRYDDMTVSVTRISRIRENV